jgi:hypothetical protein
MHERTHTCICLHGILWNCAMYGATTCAAAIYRYSCMHSQMRNETRALQHTKHMTQRAEIAGSHHVDTAQVTALILEFEQVAMQRLTYSQVQFCHESLTHDIPPTLRGNQWPSCQMHARPSVQVFRNHICRQHVSVHAARCECTRCSM